MRQGNQLIYNGIIYGSVVFVVISVVLIGWQILIIKEAVSKMPYDNKPFVRNLPQAVQRFLFIGDSTALGTGAQDNTESVAGWFAQDFPEAEILNQSANGKKLEQLEAEFDAVGSAYQLMVIQIGGNDIMKLSSIKDSEKYLTRILQQAKKKAATVVIMHSGNVGLAPVFIWPFSWILTERARQMRAMYMRKAQEEGALYIDLFTERSNDVFLRDVPKYYSADQLHPSGQGYRWWYERIRATLTQEGVSL